MQAFILIKDQFLRVFGQHLQDVVDVPLTMSVDVCGLCYGSARASDYSSLWPAQQQAPSRSRPNPLCTVCCTVVEWLRRKVVAYEVTLATSKLKGHRAEKDAGFSVTPR